MKRNESAIIVQRCRLIGIEIIFAGKVKKMDGKREKYKKQFETNFKRFQQIFRSKLTFSKRRVSSSSKISPVEVQRLDHLNLTC